MQAVDALSLELDADLSSLAMKGERVSARADEPDWSLPQKHPFWLPRKTIAYAVSQFYHGEIATAKICERIYGMMESAAAQRFLASQIADETRHAEYYGRYLNQMGLSIAPTPSLAAAYAEALAWDGAPEALVLAVQFILEGESLKLQRAVERWLPCPLFTNISHIIARDEARHFAFGKRYLAETLSRLPAEERLHIGLWLQRLWEAAVHDISDHLGLASRFVGRQKFETWRNNAWMNRLETLKCVGLFDGIQHPILAPSA